MRAKPAPNMIPRPTIPHSVFFIVPLTVSLKAAANILNIGASLCHMSSQEESQILFIQPLSKPLLQKRAVVQVVCTDAYTLDLIHDYDHTVCACMRHGSTGSTMTHC